MRDSGHVRIELERLELRQFWYTQFNNLYHLRPPICLKWDFRHFCILKVKPEIA